MTVTDTLVTIGVIFGLFILAYSAIRHKNLTEVITEIKDLIKGKAEDMKDGASNLKYA